MSGLTHANFDSATFAIYSLAENVTDERLADIAKIPQDQWEEAGMDERCVKPARPTANLSGKSLKDVVAAHVTTAHQGITSADNGGSDEASWWPHVFMVVTDDKIEDHGLLLVYLKNPFMPQPTKKTCGGAGGDDEDGAKKENCSEDNDVDKDEEKPEFAKFFFRPQKMYNILAGISLRDEDIEQLQAEYDIDVQGAGGSDVSA
ncbi:amino acid permease [Apiospora hydei]|uniref:Amino acid permease n=1 Tax=Apiospora hydei TaxID=1337664 RepID=A0ABR1X8W4_9PEZI